MRLLSTSLCKAPASESWQQNFRCGGGRKQTQEGKCRKHLKGRACLNGYLSLLNSIMGKGQTSWRQPEKKNVSLFQDPSIGTFPRLLPAPGIWLGGCSASPAAQRNAWPKAFELLPRAAWVPPHSHAQGDLRERGPLYSPRDDSQCQKRPGTGAQLNHSCSNYTNCPRDETIALVWLVRAWWEPDTFLFVKAFRLEVDFQTKVPLTPSLFRFLPGKCNLFFLKRRALKEMLPGRVRSHCSWLSPPSVKEVTLNFHYTVMRIEASTPTSSLKNTQGAAQGPFSWLHLCSPSNGTASVMEIIPSPMWTGVSGPHLGASASLQHGSASAVGELGKASLELAHAQAIEKNCDCSRQELHSHSQIGNAAHADTRVTQRAALCISFRGQNNPDWCAVTGAGLTAGANPAPAKSPRHSTKLPQVQSKARDLSLPLPTGAADSIEHPDHYQQGENPGFSACFFRTTNGKTDGERWLCPREPQCCGAGGQQQPPWSAELRTSVQAPWSPWSLQHIFGPNTSLWQFSLPTWCKWGPREGRGGLCPMEGISFKDELDGARARDSSRDSTDGQVSTGREISP